VGECGSSVAGGDEDPCGAEDRVDDGLSGCGEQARGDGGGGLGVVECDGDVLADGDGGGARRQPPGVMRECAQVADRGGDEGGVPRRSDHGWISGHEGGESAGARAGPEAQPADDEGVVDTFVKQLRENALDGLVAGPAQQGAGCDSEAVAEDAGDRERFASAGRAVDDGTRPGEELRIALRRVEVRARRGQLLGEPRETRSRRLAGSIAGRGAG